jgi:hypothetical protein
MSFAFIKTGFWTVCSGHACDPSHLGGWDQEDHSLRSAPTNSSWEPISKITRVKWTGGRAQVVECLLCKHKALSSNLHPTKQNRLWIYLLWLWHNTDYEDLTFNPYMIPTSELKPGELWLLEVDNRVILPIEVPIRILISSEDILHSWAVPSLGLKTDAIPGRLNQATFTSRWRTLLRPMLQNLWLKPQLYANCIRNSPTQILWKLILIYTLSTLWSYRSVNLLS